MTRCEFLDPLTENDETAPSKKTLDKIMLRTFTLLLGTLGVAGASPQWLPGAAGRTLEPRDKRWQDTIEIRDVDDDDDSMQDSQRCGKAPLCLGAPPCGLMAAAEDVETLLVPCDLWLAPA